MTKKDMEARCEYWLERLDMGEWAHGKVSIVIKPASEMDNALGRCSWSPEECQAEIEMREGEGESTLVHEILHLLWEGHKRYRRYNEMNERAINRLAAALTAADLR